MHPPAGATCLPFPVYFTQWAVVNFVATRDELQAVFGQAHFVEDRLDTPGIIEDNWAWQLPDGTCLRVVLAVPYDWMTVYCDPPSADRAIASLGL